MNVRLRYRKDTMNTRNTVNAEILKSKNGRQVCFQDKTEI